MFCTGKLYYDLLEKKENDGRSDVSIVRIEQLYPLPRRELTTVIKKYKSAEEYFWVQEEPANAGALAFIHSRFELVPLKFVSRRKSATPASGFFRHHVDEQKRIIEKARDQALRGNKDARNWLTAYLAPQSSKHELTGADGGEMKIVVEYVDQA